MSNFISEVDAELVVLARKYFGRKPGFEAVSRLDDLVEGNLVVQLLVNPSEQTSLNIYRLVEIGPVRVDELNGSVEIDELDSGDEVRLYRAELDDTFNLGYNVTFRKRKKGPGLVREELFTLTMAEPDGYIRITTQHLVDGLYKSKKLWMEDVPKSYVRKLFTS